jgi:ferric-dicitrate binding protein FerR (iron transport regulator)
MQPNNEVNEVKELFRKAASAPEPAYKKTEEAEEFRQWKAEKAAAEEKAEAEKVRAKARVEAEKVASKAADATFKRVTRNIVIAGVGIVLGCAIGVGVAYAVDQHEGVLDREYRRVLNKACKAKKSNGDDGDK